MQTSEGLPEMEALRAFEEMFRALAFDAMISWPGMALTMHCKHAKSGMRAARCAYRQMVIYNGRKTLSPSTFNGLVWSTYSVPTRFLNLALNLFSETGE